MKAPKKRNRIRINRHLIAGVRSLEARCIGRFYTDQLATEVHLMPLQGVNLALPQTRRQGEKHGKECRGVALRKLPVRLLQQGLRVDPREVFCGLARENLLAQEASFAHAEWNLSQKKQFAQEAALVNDTLYREGDWVPEGNPVVVLLPPGNVKVRAFVAQQLIGRVSLGSSAKIIVDGVTSPFLGRVTFISPRAEFTPPVIFSRQMREKFVFMIELSVDPETATKLHPGQPVDVQLSI